MVQRIGGRDLFTFVVPNRDQLLAAFGALDIVVQRIDVPMTIDLLLRQ
jgi:hypothetical protein